MWKSLNRLIHPPCSSFAPIGRPRRFVGACACSLAISVVSAPAAAQDVAKLRQQRTALTQQMRLADQQRAQVVAQLNSAQKTLNSVKSGHTAAKSAVDGFTIPAKHAVAEQERTQELLREANQRLDEISEQVESQQSGDSPVIKAKIDYQEKFDKYKQLVDQIKSSAEFRTKLEALQKENAPGAKVAELHDTFLKQNPALQAALAQQVASGKKYNQLREESLENDPSWQSGQTEIEQARQEHATAERAAEDAARQRAAALSKEREARKHLSSQTAVVSAIKAGLKQLDAVRGNLKRQLDHVNRQLRGR